MLSLVEVEVLLSDGRVDADDLLPALVVVLGFTTVVFTVAEEEDDDEVDIIFLFLVSFVSAVVKLCFGANVDFFVLIV